MSAIKQSVPAPRFVAVGVSAAGDTNSSSLNYACAHRIRRRSIVSAQTPHQLQCVGQPPTFSENKIMSNEPNKAANAPAPDAAKPSNTTETTSKPDVIVTPAPEAPAEIKKS